MVESGEPTHPGRQNAYAGMMILSFPAISIGCLILALELWARGLPLKP